MIEKIAESRIDVLEKVSENLGIIKNSMLTVSNLYYFNYPMSEELVKSGFSDTDSEKIKIALSKLDSMYATALNNKDIKIDYAIAMKNGFSYSTEGFNKTGLINKYMQYLWYRDVINNGKEITWVSTSESISTDEKKKYVFAAARCFLDENKNPNGMFLVYIDEKVISNAYENLIDGNSIYIIDQRGRIVSHVNKYLLEFNFYNMNMFYEMFKNKEYNIIEKSGEKYLFSKYHNDDFEWIIVEEIPLKHLLMPLYSVRNAMIVISAIIMAVGIVFSILISKRTSAPLKRLCDRLELVGKGDEGVTFDIEGWSEITKISDECNSMIRRIDNLLENVKITEQKKRKAELDFLQMQINPHFMYNTLFSIKCMVGMGKNAEAQKMLDSFISFLRNILGSRDELVTIEKELQMISEYAYILKFRFGDKFDIEYVCGEELKKCLIPRLLLQPLVENSIIHGIGPKGSRGTIIIKVEKHDGDIMISVTDNGVGIEPGGIKLGDEDKFHESKSIGLNNVNSRIKLNFGDDYGLTIKSRPGDGLTVSILLPLIK